MMIDLGNQPRSGTAFTGRMRLHQSWYRAAVLGVESGTGPRPSSTTPLGSMLRAGDAEAGLNFLTPAIFEVVKQRLKENPAKIERFRVLHNTLSSQPMCFNLFGPLAADPDLGMVLVRALWGPNVERVTRVVIEWAPTPAVDYLDDETSFDAFIEYELATGGLGFVGIETKLTEPFSPKHYDGEKYRRWMTGDGPWRPDAAGRVSDIQHNQLWRNHLMTWSMLRRPGSPYREGRIVVVRHPLDGGCARITAGYRSLLRDDSTFEDRPLDALVARWKQALGLSTWLDDFERRYLELERSEFVVARR